MDKKYLIRCIEQCLECHGARRVTHPDWADLNDRLQSEKREGESLNDTWNRLIDETWPDGNDPPEEIQCPTCEGAGKLSYWMPLQEALQELGIWQPDDWAEREEAAALAKYEGLDSPEGMRYLEGRQG